MAAPVKNISRKYLLKLAHEHIEFRIPEVIAVAHYFGIELEVPKDYEKSSPFLVVDLASEEQAKQIASRSVLVKSVYQLWGHADSFQKLKTEITEADDEIKLPYFAEDVSFRIDVEAFNKKLNQKEKVAKIEDITLPEVLPLKGTVDLKNPQHVFELQEYYGPMNIQTSETPLQLFFGRWLADGQREQITKYHIQKRTFIGNTSMDAGLSLIMANMANVGPGQLIFDPFVGSGSLLVAAAHFGALTMGCDIDYKLLHGEGKASRQGQKWRTEEENIEANFKQYGLDSYYLDVLVADSSNQGLLNKTQFFDAIITDPPYGIREATERVGTKKKKVPTATLR